tara:strand:- start:95 stop:4318 length:4224 start_codon:yes stop_codon:yes gene_type:complete
MDMNVPQITNPYPKLNYSKEVFEESLQRASDEVAKEDSPYYGMNGETLFAQTVAKQISKFNPGMPGYLNYQGLVNGTAGWFDTQPDFQNVPPNERGLTSQQILQLFVRSKETGDPVQLGSVLQGMKKGAAPGAAGFVAFNLAASKTNALMQASPFTAVPITLPQYLLRVGAPLFSGTIAAIAAQTTARNIQDTLNPDQRLLLPSTMMGETFGQIGMENFPYIFQPRFLSDKVNLGGLQVLSVNQSAYTPVKMSKSLLTGKHKVKIPLGFRLTRGTENLLNKMKADSKANPFRFYTAETGALAASTAAGTAAVEAGAGPIGQLFAEMGGGVSGGILSDLIFGGVAGTLKGVYGIASNVSEKGLIPAVTDVYRGVQSRNQKDVENFLIETIYKQFDDPEEARNHINEIIFNLSDANLSKALNKYAADNNTDVPKITSGVASRSPIILGLEKALEATSSNIQKQRGTANVQAIEAYRNAILAMYATGNPQLVKKAAEITKQVFEGDLQSNLDKSNTRLLNAFTRLKGGKDNEFSVESLSELGLAITKNIKRNKINDTARGTKLWKEINSDLEIESFIDFDGKESEVPNFITIWDEIFSGDAAVESWQDEAKIVSALINFTERKRNELGLNNVPVNTSAQGLNTTPKKGPMFNYNKLLNEAQGTKYLDNFKEAMQKAGLLDEADLTDDNFINKLKNDPETIAAIAEIERRFAPTKSDISAFGGSSPAVKGMREAEKLTKQLRLALLSKKKTSEVTPPSAEEVLEAAPDEIKPVTIGELISMRGKALALGRENPDNSIVQGIVGKFISAIEQDIDSFPQGENTAYDIARAYTKALKDVYTRSYVGDIIQKQKDGGYKFEPEQVARNLMSGNAAYRRSLELDQMNQFAFNTFISASFETGLGSQIDAVNQAKNVLLKKAEKTKDKNGFYNLKKLRKFLAENKEELEGLPGIEYKKFGERIQAVEGSNLYNNLLETVQSATSLRSTKENILRIIRAEAFNEDDPAKVNAQALLKWTQKSENKLLLKTFPDLKKDIDDIVGGNFSKLEMFKQAGSLKRDSIAEKKGLYSFYSLLGDKDETPTTVIARAIGPVVNRPIKNLDALYDSIKKSPDKWTSRTTGEEFTKKEARDGFRTAFLEAVLLNTGEGAPKPINAYRLLFQKRDRSESKMSIAEWATKNKLFTENEMKNIEEMFARMIEFEGTIMAGQTGQDVQGLLGQLGPGADLILSVLGSSVGTRFQQMFTGGGSGAQLIAAGRGASAFRDTYRSVMLNTPNLLKMDLLKDIIQDPQLLVTALRKGKNPQENRAVMQYVLDFMAKKGYITGVQLPRAAGVTLEPGPMIPPVSEEEEATTTNVQPITPQNQPVQTRPGPPPSNISQVSPSLNPVPNTQPVNRQRFAALFPEDRALIEGIGSLRG